MSRKHYEQDKKNLADVIGKNEGCKGQEEEEEKRKDDVNAPPPDNRDPDLNLVQEYAEKVNGLTHVDRHIYSQSNKRTQLSEVIRKLDIELLEYIWLVIGFFCLGLMSILTSIGVSDFIVLWIFWVGITMLLMPGGKLLQLLLTKLLLLWTKKGNVYIAYEW